MNYKSGVFFFGAELDNITKKSSPTSIQYSQLKKKWGSDISELAPWTKISSSKEGTGGEYWISGRDWEQPPIIIIDESSSILDVAWHLYRSDLLTEGGSALAVSQWAGRGQFGRSWHSPVGNLYAAWRLPEITKPWAEMLPLVVGYTIIQGLKAINKDIPFQLKWPNDLIIKRKKVGGILIEGKNKATIAGIGINLITSPGEEGLTNPNALSATSLNDFGFDLTPLSLWIKIIPAINSCFKKIIHSETPLRFISFLESCLAFMGEQVVVEGEEPSPYEGRIVGLNKKGYLQVQTVSEEKIIRSGRINLNPLLNNR
ncbi:MAG: biotin--[acetyl-CoA-carboxylase] ligase [bacterium]